MREKAEGGKRTVNRLVDTVDLALAVGDAAQAGAGQQTEGAGDDAGLVGDDITEEVAGDNDTVELAGVLDHDHGGGVDELVLDLQLGELLGHDLGDGFAPQTAGGQHVGLVQTPHGERGVVLEGEVCREPGDALDLGTRVRLRVHRVAAAVVLLALAKVDAARQLTDDVEVDATAHVRAQRRALDQRGRREVARTQVAECAHLLAKLQDTLFGADGAGAPFLLSTVSMDPGVVGVGWSVSGGTYRASDGSQKNGIGVLSSVECLVGQGRAGSINGRL